MNSGKSPATRRRLVFISRSEEHTSELQSRFDLVCRLLLETQTRIPSTPRPTLSGSPCPPPQPTPTSSHATPPTPSRRPTSFPSRLPSHYYTSHHSSSQTPP